MDRGYLVSGRRQYERRTVKTMFRGCGNS
jgi:hypothetical protein